MRHRTEPQLGEFGDNGIGAEVAGAAGEIRVDAAHFAMVAQGALGATPPPPTSIDRSASMEPFRRLRPLPHP